MTQTFAFTGQLKGFTRQAAIALVEKHGGQYVERIDQNTDILVCGEFPGSKLTKAQALGIRVITGEELQGMFAHTPAIVPAGSV